MIIIPDYSRSISTTTTLLLLSHVKCTHTQSSGSYELSYGQRMNLEIDDEIDIYTCFNVIEVYKQYASHAESVRDIFYIAEPCLVTLHWGWTSRGCRRQ